jgi:hypothetical protein
MILAHAVVGTSIVVLGGFSLPWVAIGLVVIAGVPISLLMYQGRYVTLQFKLADAADGRQHVWATIRTHLPFHERGHEGLRTLLDGKRSSISTDLDLSLTDDMWVRSRHDAVVGADWIRDFALSQIAKIRVDGIDVDAGPDAKRAALAIIDLITGRREEG